MKKSQIAATIIFTIAITCLAVYFQWAEFYEGYGYSGFNLLVSIIFLLLWTAFSFYWGTIHEKGYKKFIAVYWGINIICAIVIWILINNKLTDLFASPFYTYRGPLSLSELRHIFVHYKLAGSFLLSLYIWFTGPLYGISYIFFGINRISLDIKSLILITAPLGLLFSILGYYLGCRVSKLKKRTN